MIFKYFSFTEFGHNLALPKLNIITHVTVDHDLHITTAMMKPVLRIKITSTIIDKLWLSDCDYQLWNVLISAYWLQSKLADIL